MELETKEIDVANITTQYSSTTNSYTCIQNGGYKNRVLTEECYEEVVRIQKSIKLDEGELPEGKKIYITKGVTFPRRKFKTSYPNNELVHSIEEADVVVVDPYFNPSLYLQKYHLLKSGFHLCDYYLKTFQNPEDVIAIKHYAPIGNEDSKIKDFLKLGDKIVFDEKVLCTKTGNTNLNDEAFSKISKMLMSDDDTVKNLAMNLMTSYDYSSNKYRLAMLMILNYQGWSKCKDKKMTVEVKTFLKRLSSDFGSLHKMETAELNRFWFDIILNHPEDLIISTKFNEYVNRFVKTEKPVKLVEYEKITDTV